MKPFLKYALIASVGVILWGLVMYIGDLSRSDSGKYLNYLSYIILFACMYLAMKEDKLLNNGYLSYGKAFMTGFFLILVYSVIITVWTYVYFTILDPGLIDFIREKAIMDMEAEGVPEEQIDQAMKFIEKFMSIKAMIVFALLGNIIFGVIGDLIIAAFVKNDQPEFDKE